MHRIARATLVLLTLVCLGSGAAHAATIQFLLDGNAGQGLLGGNENPAVAGGGSGGILGGGIFYDTVTNILSIDIGWGSGNGFTDLTGTATVGHVHGGTASSAPAGFSENAGPMINLHTVTGWNSSATSGGFTGSVSFTAPQESLLLNERTYINIHTSVNPGGEIRGHLVLVPEPASALLLGLGAMALAIHRRRS